MRILLLTSDDSVKGLTSDDGFEIGRFTLSDTLGLVIVTAFIGVIAALLYLVVHRCVARLGRAAVPAMALFYGVVGGAMMVHRDGIDSMFWSPPYWPSSCSLPSAQASVPPSPTWWGRRRPAAEVIAARRAGEAADGADRGLQDLEVQLDLLHDTGSSDLDNDLGAVRERGGVHLSYRRGGHRLRIEHREGGVDRRTQFGDDNAANDGCGFGRCGVLQHGSST